MSRPKRILDTVTDFEISKATRQVERDLSLTQCNRTKGDEEFVNCFDVSDAEGA